jgi:hypothetical protein
MGRRWPWALAMTVLVVAGCGPAVGTSPGGGATASAPTTTARVGTDSVGATTPTRTFAGSSPAGSTRPPDATLAAEGGDRVVGQLGTYDWGDAGSDSPWLPGSPISTGAGEPLTVRIAGDVPIASWTARRTRGDATSDVAATAIGSGTSVIAFDAPPQGDWTIELVVRFVGGGSATYAWRVMAS